MEIQQQGCTGGGACFCMLIWTERDEQTKCHETLSWNQRRKNGCPWRVEELTDPYQLSKTPLLEVWLVRSRRWKFVNRYNSKNMFRVNIRENASSITTFFDRIWICVIFLYVVKSCNRLKKRCIFTIFKGINFFNWRPHLFVNQIFTFQIDIGSIFVVH